MFSPKQIQAHMRSLEDQLDECHATIKEREATVDQLEDKVGDLEWALGEESAAHRQTAAREVTRAEEAKRHADTIRRREAQIAFFVDHDRVMLKELVASEDTIKELEAKIA
jgi:phage shock protein A